uniref:Uncharacterized protein n=1 Tax=Aegilops tauschii subsp. strangulata TaxID=200361 RepID=A0A453NY01_AEGTS
EPPGIYPNTAFFLRPHHTACRGPAMSCLAASSATPPASRPTAQRLFVAVAAPPRWRSVEPHRAVWRSEGPRALTMLRRCSPAGDSRAPGDGSLSRLPFTPASTSNQNSPYLWCTKLME